MKRFLMLLAAVCLALLMLPAAGLAQYHAGDVAVINGIIAKSPVLSSKYQQNAPESWTFVSWMDDGSVNRVDMLNMGYDDAEYGWMTISDFTGTLDVSDLEALSALNCGDSSDLTKLILPESGSLQQLRCYNTGVSELDISGQSELTHLECYSCPDITSLDVSHNPELVHLDVEGTSISRLDVSKLKNLETLWCNGTNITSLDVSGNSKLYYLNCSNTGITSLDLSRNPELAYMSFSAEKIRTPEGYSISILQPEGGKLELMGEKAGGEEEWMYFLSAIPELGYEFVRFTGVPSQPADGEISVSFRVTGDMTLSAEFAAEKRRMLSSLSVEGVQLSVAFSPEVHRYTAAVESDVNQIKIVAKGDEEVEHIIEGDGVHALKVGENTFVVKCIVPQIPGVSSIDNPDEVFTEEYVITITRMGALPDTGDDAHAELWLGLMLLSMAALAAGAILRRRVTG